MKSIPALLLCSVLATLTACTQPPTAPAAGGVTEAQARATALAKVPGGKVQSSEREQERGHDVYSFDISRPGTKNITEILVDAATGKIIATEIETPADQQKEAAEDAAKKR